MVGTDAIVAEGIVKTFRKKGRRKYGIGPKIEKDELIYAVNNVNLQVKKGELFGSQWCGENYTR